MTVLSYAIDGLMVDSGLGCNRGQLVAWAREQGVRRAVITHHHEDHSGGAAGLREAGIPVSASAPTARALREGFALRMYQKMVWGPAEQTTLEPVSRTVETERYRFTVYPAPGHCDDQVVLHEPSQGWLFSGDAFLHRRVKYFRADEDFARTVSTLEHLCSLEFDALFCAHRPVLTGGREALREKLQHLRDLEGRVRELHAQGLPIPQIVPRVLGPEPWLQWFLTRGDVGKRNLVRSILHGPVPRNA